MTQISNDSDVIDRGKVPMLPAGHRIDIDPPREFMRVTLWGEWANAQTDGLTVAHAQATQAMIAGGVRRGRFLTLVDMRDKRLTQAETVREFRRSFEAGSPSRRTAIIVPPALPRSIAEAIDPLGRVRVVHTEEEALAWLFETP